MWCGWGGGLVVYEFCGVGLRFLREVWVVRVLSVGVGVLGRVGGSRPRRGQAGRHPGFLVVWVGVVCGDVLCTR